MFVVPERNRVKSGKFASTIDSGNNGLFVFPLNKDTIAHVIATQTPDWEMISIHISTPHTAFNGGAKIRMAKNEEIENIIPAFWSTTDDVMRIYFSKAKKIRTLNPAIVQIWRPVKRSIPMPPSIMYDTNGEVISENHLLTDFINEIRNNHEYSQTLAGTLSDIISDTFLQSRKKDGKRTLSQEDIKTISTNAAIEIVESFKDHG